jgi:hypothetical protein
LGFEKSDRSQTEVVPCAIGAQIAIDIVNERGGVAGKYKVQPINADSQSKADAAINEVERLINQEKVEIVLDVYARHREGADLSRTTSAHAPRAALAARKAGQNNTDNSRVTARRSHRAFNAEKARQSRRAGCSSAARWRQV